MKRVDQALPDEDLPRPGESFLARFHRRKLEARQENAAAPIEEAPPLEPDAIEEPPTDADMPPLEAPTRIDLSSWDKAPHRLHRADRIQSHETPPGGTCVRRTKTICRSDQRTAVVTRRNVIRLDSDYLNVTRRLAWAAP